jgi:hypothetical protein
MNTLLDGKTIGAWVREHRAPPKTEVEPKYVSIFQSSFDQKSAFLVEKGVVKNSKNAAF